MPSPVQLDNDIWYMVVDILYARTYDRRPDRKRAAEASLLALRLTSRALAFITAPYVVHTVHVSRLDDRYFERMHNLLKWPATCEAIKRYEFRPDIIRSRQGDFGGSAYHKIPPHLDYGRQTNSPIIQEENRQLRQAAAHWAQQYRILYPTNNKAAAALKGLFSYSSTRGAPRLKDSVFFTALDKFSNLAELRVEYPKPDNSKMFNIVSTEYSIALGRYLAKNPAYLTTLELVHITPQELALMLQSMTDAAGQNIGQLQLAITHLTITFTSPANWSNESLHVYPKVGQSVATLLQHTSGLKALRVNYSTRIHHGNRKFDHGILLLSPFQPPQLPQLKELRLVRLAFAAEDLIALVTSSPSRLSDIYMDWISLTTSTWAYVLRTFATSNALEYCLEAVQNVQDLLYHNVTQGNAAYKITEEDMRAQGEWVDKIDERVGKSLGDLEFTRSDM